MISFGARQRFRQRLQNIEDADEILDALNQFIERFTLIDGHFSSNQYQTIYQFQPKEQETIMVSLAPLLNLTEQDLDNLFILASTL